MSKMFIAQADQLANTLIVHGYPQFASARVSSVAADALEQATARMYGKPIPLRLGRESLLPGGRYFAEDN
jgi:hypothetical protein